MTNHTKTKHFAQGTFLLGLFILVTISLITLFFISSNAHASLNPTITLTSPHPRVSRNGTFQISIFQDLHYGEAENTLWGPEQDVNTTRVINAVLDAEAAQLVVLNGDLITGENTHVENSTDHVDVIVETFVRRGVSWASCYGNHDSGYNLSRLGIWQRERMREGCLTQRMVQGGDEEVGVTNYYIPIYGTSATPEFLLWFFDSRGGNRFRQTDAHGAAVPIPDWVHPSVVDWFLDTSSTLARKYEKHIPSVAFVHIPVAAMLAFQEGGVDKHTEPGINDDVPLSAQGGEEDRGKDRAFMEALVDTKGLMGVFSGHDHGNSWCQRWNTTTTTLPDTDPTPHILNLCFGQHTGYGGYGSWIRGSRQVLLRTDRQEIETWVRFEDGSVGGRVVLNGTYGMDVYPVVVDRDSYGGIL